MTLPCGPLSCPEPDNYAAIAKQLHETALEAEACIFKQEIALRSMVNRPSQVKVTTAPITGIFASFDQVVVGGSQLYVFNNTGMFTETGPDNSTDIYNFLGEGMYEIGWACTAIASGAVTDNSVRIFRIEHQRPDPTAATGFQIINETGYTLFETNTGNGTDVSFAGIFRIRPGDSINLMLFHNNASDLTISTGMYVYMCKVSDVSLRQVL
jgi:hypothetical protein